MTEYLCKHPEGLLFAAQLFPPKATGDKRKASELKGQGLIMRVFKYHKDPKSYLPHLPTIR